MSSQAAVKIGETVRWDGEWAKVVRVYGKSGTSVDFVDLEINETGKKIKGLAWSDWRIGKFNK